MLTLRSSVHDHLRDESENEVLAKSDGEAEASPVMSVLEGLETVAIELNIPVKIGFIERLHGNLALAMVLGAVCLLLESEVVLDGASTVFGFLVLSGGDGGSEDPHDRQDRKTRE